MQVYLVTLGKGLQGPARMNGALFLGDQGVHFLCASLGKGGSYDFSRFGGVGAQLERYRSTGTAPSIAEAELVALLPSVEHSFSIPSGKLELISRAFCSGSKIVHDGGQKLIVWNPGFAGQFREQTKQWAAAKGIKTEGL